MIGASGASSNAAGGSSGTASLAAVNVAAVRRRRVAGGGTMVSSSRARRRPGCARVPPEGTAGGAGSGSATAAGAGADCEGASASTNTKRKGFCSTAPSRRNWGRREAGRARQIKVTAGAAGCTRALCPQARFGAAQRTVAAPPKETTSPTRSAKLPFLGSAESLTWKTQRCGASAVPCGGPTPKSEARVRGGPRRGPARRARNRAAQTRQEHPHRST